MHSVVQCYCQFSYTGKYSVGENCEQHNFGSDYQLHMIQSNEQSNITYFISIVKQPDMIGIISTNKYYQRIGHISDFGKISPILQKSTKRIFFYIFKN